MVKLQHAKLVNPKGCAGSSPVPSAMTRWLGRLLDWLETSPDIDRDYDWDR